MPQGDAGRSSPLPSGTVIDHYRLMRPIARGGMGEVYLARDTRLGRRVALKIIRTEHEGSDDATNALLFEAQTIARFSHPNIVTVFAVGEFQGRPYLALEYLEGDNLEERLDERRPSVGEALRVGQAIAGAVSEAHEHKVLHLDLKPANVIIPRDGRLRVLDFGLAKIVRDRGSVEDTQGGTAGWGTPAYTAPEQWRRREATEATDVWSLGIMLFELFARRLPYEQPSPVEMGRAICSDDPAPSLSEVADVPPDAAALVASCLRKDPSERPTAREVYEALTELIGGGSITSMEESPFRGLLPFTSRHAPLFFGRDAEIAAFVERARHHGVLPIVGPSGAGKSSFVQAGVIPRLREQGEWVVLRLRPGARPFETLVDRLRRRDAPPAALQAGDDVEWSSASTPSASISQIGLAESAKITPTPGLALDDDPAEIAEQLRETPRRLALLLRRLADETNRNVLLVVEQLEQVLTMVEDQRTARRFISALCTAADDALEPVRVIFTVRDDALGRIATGPEVREALANMTVIQTLDARALERVLVAPVEAMGYRYESDEIVKKMSEAVRGEPGSLPLLQFAAQKLWEKRDTERRLLLASAYEEMGGVEGALARHADEVIDGLSDEERAIARELLVRQVTPERTRQAIPAARAKEGLGAHADDVLDRLAQSRIIAVTRGRDGAGPRVELAHQSLIGRWSTLSKWIDEARGDLAFLADAGPAADLWERRGRRPEELWRGDALADALRRRERLRAAPPVLVDEFLQAGLHRERRRQRRRRASLIFVISLSVLIAAIGVLAAVVIADKEKDAVAARDRAEHQTAVALREAALAAARAGDLLAARAKLRVALTTEDAPLARALWRELRDDPRVWTKQLGSLVRDVKYSPDDRHIAVGCQDTAIYVIDTVTRETQILRGARDQVNAVAWSPDGLRLASAVWSGEVVIWDLESARPLHRIAGHDAIVQALSYSPDGRWVASGGVGGEVRVWNPETGAPGPVLQAPGNVMVLQFSPDGSRLAAATSEGIALWEHFRGEPRIIGEGSLQSMAFSRDGTMLAGGLLDASAVVWRVDTGEVVAKLVGHSASIDGLTFDASGERLITGSGDKTVRIWRISNGEHLRTLDAHDAGVSAVDVDSTGQHLVTGSRDRTVRLWDLDRERMRDDIRGHTAGVYRVAFSPDGSTIVSGAGDKTIRLWDVATADERMVLTGHTEGVDSVGFSPDGRYIASGSIDLTARIWDAETGMQVQVLMGHAGRVWEVAFSPDGRRLATSSTDGNVRIFSTRSGELLNELTGHDGAVYALDYSPDGRTLASVGRDHTLRLWPVGHPGAAQVLRGHDAALYGVGWGPAGDWIATGGDDFMVRIWDLGDGSQRVLGPHGGRVYWMDVDPQGKWIAAPTSNGEVTLWSVADATRHAVLAGHRDEVNTTAFSPDGSLVASAADDGSVRVWEVASGRPFWRAPILMQHPAMLYSHEGWKPLDPAAVAEPPGSAGWRQLVENEVRQGDHHGGGRACVVTHEGSLQWWALEEDRRVAATEVEGVLDVRAAKRGCVARMRDRVVWLDEEGSKVLAVESPIDAIDVFDTDDGARVVVAAAGGLVLLDPRGDERMSAPLDPGVTAVAQIDGFAVVGFRDGALRRVQPDGEIAETSFEGVPASVVERIARGPEGIVIAGFANGAVGMWSLDSGSRLALGRLHGRVRHLVVDGGMLYAATDLGHSLRWDLDVLLDDYCSVLREVWARVPVVWVEGAPQLEEPPSDHPCAE